MILDQAIKSKILAVQKNEITEYFVYQKLSQAASNGDDKKTLTKIAAEELDHYNFWKTLTNQDIQPNKLRVFFYFLLSRFFGLNFGVRLMELGEKTAQAAYQELKSVKPEMVDQIIRQEEIHEEKMLKLINPNELAFTGSIVLGLNDALVELTGALAGLTLALHNTKVVALAASITGFAASMAMAGSEYLSTKEEGTRSPFKSGFYTGVAYIIAVALLVSPYFYFKNPFICLGTSLTIAILIVFIFTFYISVAKKLSFKKRFLEMAAISLGVAVVNFFVGFLVRKFFNIEV